MSEQGSALEQQLRRSLDIQAAVNSLLRLSLEEKPLEEILQRAIDLILSLPWLVLEGRGCILLVENQPGVLAMKAERGLSTAIRTACARVPFGTCLCGKAALNQCVEFADRLDSRHEITYEEIHSHGHYCVPIIYADETLGVISVYLRTGHARNSQEVEFLNTVANALAGIITRQRAEEARSRYEKRYHDLVEGLDAIVWEAAARPFRFIYASRRAESLIGYPVEQWLRDPCFLQNHAHPDDRERVANAIVQATDSPGHEELDFRALRADGSPISLRCVLTTRMPGDGDTQIRGMVLDMTAHRQTEEEYRRLEGQLQQSQRLDAIGRLAGGVAHDFNNLLTAIEGHAELAGMALSPGHPASPHLQQIQVAAERAGHLTTQLLLFSRRQTSALRPVSLNQIVRAVMGLLERLIGEDIQVTLDLEPQLPNVLADHGNLEQVLMNLVVNARDAMPRGGRIVLGTRPVTMESLTADDPPDASPGSFSCLTVADTGSGMDAATLSRIFEPFFTTKESHQGTGLGLSVVYGIVRQHGGWIRVTSQPGMGATFEVFLPSMPDAFAPPTQSRSVVHAPRGRGESVLLVEDEEGVRYFAAQVLDEGGYIVHQARSAEEALDLVARQDVTCDVLFSDVVLPGITGPQLMDVLLPRHPTLKTLFASGYLDDRSQKRLLDGRGLTLIAKPYTRTELLQQLHDVLAGPTTSP